MAFDFVTKPVDLADLEITIRKTLDEIGRVRELDRRRAAAERTRREEPRPRAARKLSWKEENAMIASTNAMEQPICSSSSTCIAGAAGWWRVDAPSERSPLLCRPVPSSPQPSATARLHSPNVVALWRNGLSTPCA
jgi:hypothetical protein